MTLAPDYQAFTVSRETGDTPPTVCVIPDGDFRGLTEEPVTIHATLTQARDVVLWHLFEGHETGYHWELAWAHTTTDLHNRVAIPHRDFEFLVADYAHFARINGGLDWDPQDAEDLHQQIDRHLRAAGYREGNQA